MSQSLFKLESEIAELLEIRQDLLSDPESADELAPAIAQVENQLSELFGAEVRKVDGIRKVWAHLEMVADAAAIEQKRQAERARIAKSQLERLKDGVKTVMQMMPWHPGKPRKIEGQTGVLYLKANGGKQAVEITDESLVPDEYCEVTATFRADDFAELSRILAEFNKDFKDAPLTCRNACKSVSLTLVAAALTEKCQRCNGNGVVEDSVRPDGEVVPGQNPCKVCGGEGHEGVPGARLVPRGEHVEMR